MSDWSVSSRRFLKRGQDANSGNSTRWSEQSNSSWTSSTHSSLGERRFEKVPVGIEGEEALLGETDERLVRREQSAADDLLVGDALREL